MLDLSEITKAGFGGYRISIRSPIHTAAFNLALNAGCNLVDTASNYANGESELLIGSAILQHDRSRLFIMTKAGYVSEIDREFFKAQGARAARSELLLDGARNVAHCIHPDYLRFKFKSSLNRLNLKYVDAALLHNPEYHIVQPGITKNDYLRRIAKAFALLDELCDEGIIRYYGISSNTLALSDMDGSITIDDIINCVGQCRHSNKFRFVQVPVNLAEWTAVMPRCGGSLAYRARSRGLIIVANRPLNAKVENSMIRLVGAENVELGNQFDNLFEDGLRMLNLYMGSLGIEGKVEDVPQVRILKEKVGTVTDPDLVVELLDATLYPVVVAIFAAEIPFEVQRFLDDLRREAANMARSKMYGMASSFVSSDTISNRLGAVDAKRLLHVRACEAVLRAGADHVLIGMRRPKYVDEFCHLFSVNRSEISGSQPDAVRSA